ncbi:heterocyst differentiation protein [Richelia intracellularis HH01]|uniref:Heterocyst differentiation protein n=2 Tax=Richelia TaxID=98443 RepID=M1X3D2_9NOST|nr:heterocyst differentiation protein [Richelia intracellularis HH01]
MAQEFYISVTPVARNDYLVRTEKVAPGVPLAEELVTWSISDWLATAEQLMNDPLESLLQEGTNIHRSRAEK